MYLEFVEQTPSQAQKCLARNKEISSLNHAV